MKYIEEFFIKESAESKPMFMKTKFDNLHKVCNDIFSEENIGTFRSSINYLAEWKCPITDYSLFDKIFAQFDKELEKPADFKYDDLLVDLIWYFHRIGEEDYVLTKT